MGRSPSRERKRERDRRRKRSRDRERDRSETRKRRRDRDRDRSRDRSRDKSLRRSRSRSRSEDRHYDRTETPGSSRQLRSATAAGGERPALTDADLEGKSVEEREMMKTMGFCGFDTTKNKKVEGNESGEVHVILKRKYRQYMNRKGGFNRPLDFVA